MLSASFGLKLLVSLAKIPVRVHTIDDFGDSYAILADLSIDIVGKVGFDLDREGRWLSSFYDKLDSCRQVSVIICLVGRNGLAACSLGRDHEFATVWYNFAVVDRNSNVRIEETCLCAEGRRSPGEIGDVWRHRQVARAVDGRCRCRNLAHCEHESAHKIPIHARW